MTDTLSETLPAGLTIRPATLEDAEITLALMHADELHYLGETNSTLDELKMYWTVPGFNLQEQNPLVFTQDGQLVASLYLEYRHITRYFADTLVRFKYDLQNPALGDYLLKLGEDWAHKTMVQADPDLRVTLSGWTNSKNQLMQQRYARLGYKEVRRYWEMEIIQTEAPPEPVWPAGIEIRPFEPEKHAFEVWQMMDTAFADHYGHVPGNFEQWKHRRLEQPSFDASLWIVAWADGQPVGGAFSNVEGDHGYVGTLGNLRAWRGKGLGMALLRATFGEFWRRGMPRVTLGADSQNLTGAVKLYQKAGMYVASEDISFEKELRPGREISTQTLAE